MATLLEFFRETLRIIFLNSQRLSTTGELNDTHGIQEIEQLLRMGRICNRYDCLRNDH